jgi:hypothetical protein
MKLLKLFLIALFSSVGVISQNYQTIEEVDTACAQLGFSADEEAEIAVDNILAQIGLFRNFTIQECSDINNAVAKNIDVGAGRKERFILYDQNFFKRIEDKAANDWAAVSILAHEIGHHLNGHALNDEGSSHKWELEADEFSGFVLGRMGANADDAKSAINTLQYEKATRTHPAKIDRLAAIEKGWARGNGKIIPINKITETEKKIIDNEIELVDEGDKKGLAQKILGKYIQAVGGQEKAMQIRSIFHKIKMTTKSVINDEEYNSEMNMDITYQSPSRYMTNTDMNGQTYYTLSLDGKTYNKVGDNSDWKFSNNSDLLKNQVSFVWELSLLVNNEEVKYLGKEIIEGVECHAVQLPDFIIDQDMETFTMKSISKIVNYYDVNSGLLAFNINNGHSIIDYKENNEYLKDSDTKSTGIIKFSNYKEAGGVLFPGKMIIKNSGASNSETVMEFEEIRANVEINKDDFKVKD